MGECQSCQNVEPEVANAVIVGGEREYVPTPTDFYSETTRAVARRIGEFKYDEDDTGGLVKKGPVEMEEGFRYLGHFKDGMRNGRGKQVAQDYTLYEGYWRDDIYEGRGRMIYANGEVYEGDWEKGKRHGKGVYTKLDGSNFTGQWVQDEQHGYGIEKWADGASYGGHYEHGVI